MCECLEYEDGSMHLCEACGPMHKEQAARIAALVEAVEGLELVAIRARAAAVREQKNSDGMDDKFNTRGAWITEIDAALAAAKKAIEDCAPPPPKISGLDKER